MAHIRMSDVEMRYVLNLAEAYVKAYGVVPSWLRDRALLAVKQAAQEGERRGAS